MKVVSSVAIRPPLNVRSMLFSDRLSAALMLNRRPPEMSCVSPAVFVREMTGGVTSSCWPLMLRVVSHAHSTSASAPIPHIAVPRLDIPISVLSAIAPVVVRRLLPGGRHQIGDDVRPYENQQISPVLLLGREAEQLSQNREIYKERNSGLRYRDLCHRKSANYGRFAVIGGLTVTEVTVTKSGIPFLVDLPILGKLFGFTSQQENRRDLLILITPHIIDDLVAPAGQ